jgi:hypothetical protein
MLATTIEIARDAPGSVACGRSGLPLLVVCPCGRRRLIPFRLLKTRDTDRIPLYCRPFKCRVCGSGEVTLFDIETQAELDAVRELLPPSPQPWAPTNYAPLDPDRDLP